MNRARNSGLTGRALRVANLGKSYGPEPVFTDINFHLPAGETLAVVGPSGCGKSTLLSLLAGLAQPTRGVLRYGDALDAPPPRIAFILQDYGLFPWKTVEENLALPLKLQGVLRRERRARAAAMLQEMDLTGLERRYPSQLSGGQRQRVAIGRALITEPEVLLMDEPFSSLDALTRERLQNVVLELWQRRRPTCVLVTHQVEEAAFLGGRVMVLGGKPSRMALWARNDCFGDASCRESDAYFSLVRRIHTTLAGLAAATDPGPTAEESRLPLPEKPADEPDKGGNGPCAR